MKPLQTAAAIIINDRKLLAVREVGKEFFIAPGGQIESGENAKQTLVRELQEELGATVNVVDLESFGNFEADAVNHPGRRVHMKAFLVREFDACSPNSEIEELKWLSSNDTEVKVGHIFRLQIIPMLKSKGLID